MKRRVADIVMDTLADLGISQAFCVVGGGSMYLNNALGITDRIKTIYCHHEQACSMAAEGWAKYNNGKPALVQVTTGPGGTNAITGVMGAYIDSVPMFVISGQCRYNTSVPETGLPLRTRGVQEFNIVDTVKTMTKYVKMVLDPLAIKREIYKAYDIAMNGRKGPVWLDIPQNVQNAQIETDDLLEPEPRLPILSCKDSEVSAVIEKLRNAKRPCILAGGGIRLSGSQDRFLEFLSRIHVPVVTAGAQPDVLYRRHELCAGVEGLRGQRGANFVVQNADVVLVLGASLTYSETGWDQSTFVPHGEVIMVNIDEYEFRKPGLHVDTFVHGDLGSFFDITRGIVLSAPADWLAYATNVKNRFDPFEGRVDDMSRRVNGYNLWREFSLQAGDDAVICLGNSSCISGWLCLGSDQKNQRSFVNVNCGSMGDDLTEAEGVAAACGRPVTLITGDGSFMMNLQELATIHHNELPVHAVVFSNLGYNSLRKTFSNYFNGVNAGCDGASGISFPDFERVADAFSIPWHHCHNNGEVKSSLEWLMAQPGPALLIVDEDFERPIAPSVISRLREDGSSEPAVLQDMSPYLDRETYKELMVSEKECL